MVYYAKVNTADPRVGQITVGEYLTDAQASALGEDLLEKLVARGVLGRDAGSDGTNNANNGADNANNGANNANNGAAEDAPEDAPEDENDDGDGMPELSVSDVVVNDAEDAAKPAPRKTRRNSK